VASLFTFGRGPAAAGMTRADALRRFRGNQRKRKFVKRFRDLISAVELRVCAAPCWRLPRWGLVVGLGRLRACWRAPWLVQPGAGMRRSARRRPGAPALDVVQAGSGSLQRSTGLVRGPGRAGGAALGFRRGGPRRLGGLAPPSGKGLWSLRGPLLACAWLAAGPAVMRPWRGRGRARRRRSGHPSGCRARSATRSSAAATRRRRRGIAPA